MKILQFGTTAMLVTTIPVTPPSTPGGVAPFLATTLFDLELTLNASDTVVLMGLVEATNNNGYTCQFAPFLGFGADLNEAPEPLPAIYGGTGITGTNITPDMHHNARTLVGFHQPGKAGTFHYLLNVQADSSDAQAGAVLEFTGAGGGLWALVFRQTKG